MCNSLPYSSNMSIVNDLTERANQDIVWGTCNIQRLMEQSEKTEIVREAYCCGATLHRGYYHPSPVYDLIVGNTKRGRLSAKSTRPYSHRYCFDRNDKLVRIEYLHDGRVSHIEYLDYCEQFVRGITVDCNGFLSAVTEEQYSHNRIVSFSISQCYHVNGAYTCFDYHKEEYCYDEYGLSKCQFVNLTPGSGYMVDEVYSFDRENGFLVSFSPDTADTNADQRVTYTIRKRRKA